MSAMQAEVFEAFRAIDVPEDKALRAAASLARALTTEIGSASAPQLADMAAVKSDIATIRADGSSLRTDFAAVKADVAVLKADVSSLKTDVTGLKVGMTRVEGELTLLKWMTGFGLAFLVAITLKLFVH